MPAVFSREPIPRIDWSLSFEAAPTLSEVKEEVEKHFPGTPPEHIRVGTFQGTPDLLTLTVWCHVPIKKT